MHTIFDYCTLYSTVAHYIRLLHTIFDCCALYSIVAHFIRLLHTIFNGCTLFNSCAQNMTVAHYIQLLHTIFDCCTPYSTVAHYSTVVQYIGLVPNDYRDDGESIIITYSHRFLLLGLRSRKHPICDIAREIFLASRRCVLPWTHICNMSTLKMVKCIKRCATSRKGLGFRV